MHLHAVFAITLTSTGVPATVFDFTVLDSNQGTMYYMQTVRDECPVLKQHCRIGSNHKGNYTTCFNIGITDPACFTCFTVESVKVKKRVPFISLSLQGLGMALGNPQTPEKNTPSGFPEIPYFFATKKVLPYFQSYWLLFNRDPYDGFMIIPT